MKLAYLKDKFSKDILLHDNGTQIMMESSLLEQIERQQL